MNVPASQLSAEEVSMIYRMRWQIELLFKLYKSYFGINKLKATAKYHRVLCGLYSKLIIILSYFMV